jgi:hypothetical protein
MVMLMHTRFQLVITEPENDITQGKTRTIAEQTIYRTVYELVHRWVLRQIMEEIQCQLLLIV